MPECCHGIHVVFHMLQVFSTSKGLTKTVFNPAVLKTAQRNSEETLKKKQVQVEIEEEEAARER